MSGPRYTILPNELLADQRLERSHISVVNVLGNHANRSGWCKLKQKTIADAAGVTRETVNRALADLEAWGWIEKAVRPGYASQYRLCMDSKADPFEAEKPAKGCEAEITSGCDGTDHTGCDVGDHTGCDLQGSHHKNDLSNDLDKRLAPTRSKKDYQNGLNKEEKANGQRPSFTITRNDPSWRMWLKAIEKAFPNLLEAAEHHGEIHADAKWPENAKRPPSVKQMPRNVTGEAA